MPSFGSSCDNGIWKGGSAKNLTTRFVKEIEPYLENQKHTRLLEVQKHYLDIITLNLENIFIPASQSRSFSHKPFAETEIKIVNLMKEQKSSKEIAAILQVSTGAIRTRRENIKKITEKNPNSIQNE